jgi:hypothetical protein
MQGLSKRDFVPLADVPDMVWKVGPHKRGGPNSPEHANHFADMDRVLNSATEPGVVSVRETRQSKFQQDVRVGQHRFHVDEPEAQGGSVTAAISAQIQHKG